MINNKYIIYDVVWIYITIKKSETKKWISYLILIIKMNRNHIILGTLHKDNNILFNF